MNKLLDNLYNKSQLGFALAWIGVYCVGNSIGMSVSEAVGVEGLAELAVNAALSVVLFAWINQRGLLRHYGLCRASVPASRFLWYIPLILFVSHNAWFGLTLNSPILDAVCCVLAMLFVGFLEEVIFRGLLFRALAKDGIVLAIVVSSVTFGFGHILNLFNGSGMDLVSNICQVAGAIACGFLFVIIFYRGGSLIPCIIAHGANNAVNVFANQAALTPENQVMLSLAVVAIAVAYAVVLLKTLPKPKEESEADAAPAA